MDQIRQPERNHTNFICSGDTELTTKQLSLIHSFLDWVIQSHYSVLLETTKIPRSAFVVTFTSPPDAHYYTTKQYHIPQNKRLYYKYLWKSD